MAQEPKKADRRDRVPQAVIDAIDDLIRGGAKALEARDVENAGCSTDEIVREVHANALREAKLCIDAVFDNWVASRVPLVLGAVPEKRTEFWQPLLPGIVLPAYFSVPPERDATDKALGPAVWKRDRKVTPNELDRIIEHARKEIAGRQKILQWHVIVRETALRRGCDPDEAIGSVLDRDPGSSLAA